MNNNRNRIYFGSWLLLLLPTVLWAQADSTETAVGKTPFAMQYYQESQYYLSTNNASGLVLGSKHIYSDINLSYDYMKGDYRRPQQPDQANRILFQAEGATMLGTCYVIGGFNFKQAFEDNIGFSSILNPYRGTPYIVADSTGGDWTKQTYDMWVKAASPVFFNTVSFGLGANLGVGRGAKKIDPRPQANSNSIQLAPSFTLSRWGHSLGGNFMYNRFRESSNMMLYDTGEPQKIYLLKGMGQYTYDIFSTNERERQYEGDSYGAGVQYGYQSDRFQLFFEGTYENYQEYANDIENSKPRQRGIYYETQWQGNLHLDVWSNNRSMKHSLYGGYENIAGSGREIIQVFNSSPEVNAWVTDSEAPKRTTTSLKEWNAGYRLFLMNRQGDSYKWKFSANAKLSDYSDEYAVMGSYLRFKDCKVALKVVRNVYMKENQYLQIAVDGLSRSVWEKEANYVARETKDNTIAEGLVAKDNDILTQSYYSLGTQAMYGYRINPRNSVYVKANYHYLHSESKLSMNQFTISLGYNF